MCKQRSPDPESTFIFGKDYLNSLVNLRIVQDASESDPAEREKPLVFAWIMSNLCLRYVENIRKDSATILLSIPQQYNMNSPYLTTHSSFYSLKYIKTNEQLYALLSSIKAATKDFLSFEESTDESNIVLIKISFTVDPSK